MSDLKRNDGFRFSASKRKNKNLRRATQMHGELMATLPPTICLLGCIFRIEFLWLFLFHLDVEIVWFNLHSLWMSFAWVFIHWVTHIHTPPASLTSEDIVFWEHVQGHSYFVSSLEGWLWIFIVQSLVSRAFWGSWIICTCGVFKNILCMLY